MKESQPTYIVTQDTRSIFERINRGELSRGFLAAADYYFSSIQRIINENFDNSVKVIGYKENDISKRLGRAVFQELSANKNIYCICLDRYLLADIEKKFPDRFFRFSITRTADDRKSPRCGDPTFTEQIKDLKRKIPDLSKMQGIIADDGIFSGGTIRDMLNLFRSSGENINIKRIIGFIGSEDKNNGTKILEPVDNLFEWVDVRDYGPFSGKTVAAGRNNMVAAATPYLYPWSLGEGASFDKSPKLMIMSRAMILQFQKLVKTFEEKQYGKRLRFRDLVKAGFTLPVATNKDVLPISINNYVIDYLDRCLEKISAEQNRQVKILDMDGTLYRLDGIDGGYSGSTLEKRVKENALRFIVDKESCSLLEAQGIYAAGAADPVGLSQYLSVRYKISRNDYFDIVWNIDPSQIVKQFETPVSTIKAIKNTDTKLILLTSAPRVWTKRVLETLDLKNAFELVITGDQFATKEEIFRRLAGWYLPANVISIGDQEKTDIIPAKKFGFSTLLVQSPDDVKEVLKDYE